MSRPRPPSKRERLDCWDNALAAQGTGQVECAICGLPIDPDKDRWEADHRIPAALNGSNKWPNLRPVHKQPCHASKTAEDVSVIAKVIRVRERHLGIRDEPKRPIARRAKQERRPYKPSLPRLPYRKLYEPR